MSKKNKDMAFEDRLRRLQTIVTSLECGENPLEESVTLYKEGLAHAAACREQLAKARNEIEICTDGALAPFSDQGEDSHD